MKIVFNKNVHQLFSRGRTRSDVTKNIAAICKLISSFYLFQGKDKEEENAGKSEVRAYTKSSRSQCFPKGLLFVLNLRTIILYFRYFRFGKSSLPCWKDFRYCFMIIQ